MAAEPADDMDEDADADGGAGTKEGGAKEGEAAKPKVPLQKWNVLFNHSAFQAYTLQHPEVIEPDDDQVKSAITHIVETGDMNELKIRTVIEKLTARFGALREERTPRIKGFIVNIVQAKLAVDAKANAKKAAAAGPNKKDDKDKGCVGQPEVRRAPQTKIDAATDVSITINTDSAEKTIEDVQWAVTVLAPLGLREDSEDLVMQPPAKKAMPVLRALQAAAPKSDHRKVLRETQIGKVMNYLRRNPDAEVKRCAQELLRVYRDACAKKQKTEHAEAIKDA